MTAPHSPTDDRLKHFKLIKRTDSQFELQRAGVPIATPDGLSAAATIVAGLTGQPVWFVPDAATQGGAEPFTYDATRRNGAAR
jgi:hypothetical protein